MKIVKRVEDAVNARNIPAGAVIYTAGNAATPVMLLRQLAEDEAIKDVSLLSVLLLGEVQDLFADDTCERIEHRVIFNGPHSRKAMNTGKASYQWLDFNSSVQSFPSDITNHIPIIARMPRNYWR
jgi:4-hydroxybutyrate CoA-transferase